MSTLRNHQSRTQQKIIIIYLINNTVQFGINYCKKIVFIYKLVDLPLIVKVLHEFLLVDS